MLKKLSRSALLEVGRCYRGSYKIILVKSIETSYSGLARYECDFVSCVHGALDAGSCFVHNMRGEFKPCTKNEYDRALKTYHNARVRIESLIKGVTP